VDAQQQNMRVLLGRIADAYGVHGEVLIHAYTSPPENIAAYGPLTDERGTAAFAIQSARVDAWRPRAWWRGFKV